MYTNYWGLTSKPFENTPDPRFFYCSPKHEEAMMRLLYAVEERKGSAMLSGEYGGGKTLLSRIVMAKLMQEEDKFRVALIVNPAIPSLELLGEVVYQLGGEGSKNDRKIDILRNLNQMLYKTSGEGRHTVVIIDEAQAIEDETTFEELRLLLNFQLNEQFLLTLLLLGQPELRMKIDNLPQFKQRLAVRYHLTTLTEDEVRHYIEHRVRVAGKNEPIFTEDAYKLIYEYSKGVPRQINNVCDLGLVIGMGHKARIIDSHIIKEIIKDFQHGQDLAESVKEV
ncbi:MAG TPA: AAA family ATPase [Candidatus Omnitrophota bacterium]|nr:AAA family ATPase [Candidatus Omnitrophota bacterium]